jgi:hypothetical protein
MLIDMAKNRLWLQGLVIEIDLNCVKPLKPVLVGGFWPLLGFLDGEESLEVGKGSRQGQMK